MTSFVLFVLLFGISQAATLPGYIAPCKDGPKLNECALINGNKAIPMLSKGDAKHRLPPLDPMKITQLSVMDNGARTIAVNLTLSDLTIVGLKDATLTKADMSTKAKRFIFFFTAPKVTITGKYKINGKILLLPITGDGPVHIVLDKPQFELGMEYNIYNEKGEAYSKITKSSLKYTTSKMTVKLDNLFNGNKLLGDNMNQVLNENWKELSDQLGTPVAEGINLICRQMMENVSKNVPFKNIVKP